MPLDYPPELVCTAYCNNVECDVELGVLCQHGDYKSDVEAKLRDWGWIVAGDEVFCSERCRIRHTAAVERIANVSG
jgi:hypothetical protein